jgi:hypothetical protein
MNNEYHILLTRTEHSSMINISKIYIYKKSQLRDRDGAWCARGPEFKTDIVNFFLTFPEYHSIQTTNKFIKIFKNWDNGDWA